MSKEYIYTLKIDGEVIYCGRTNNIKRRHTEHLNDRSGTKKSTLIQNALKEGKTVEIEVIHTVEAGQLEGLESDTIDDLYNRGHMLSNSKGGDTGLLRGEAARELNRVIQHTKIVSKKIAKRKKIEAAVVPLTPEQKAVEEDRHRQYQNGSLSLEQWKALRQADGVES